ncbi:MAG: restriction endonuclease subunit S, partial [Leptospiraceae bacterium]|nr:restriction endonuclease subunit S [Leptospiraceae bacterium]MDW7977120.1 restriction endonuclease subunit S [Leptospiraceae bacterium]
MSIRFNIERDFKNTEIGLIPIDWQEKKLKNYCKVISGYAFKSNDFISDGILVVKISNLQNGTIIVDQKSSFFPRDKIFDEHKKFLLKEGDILIALTGATIGKVAVVPKKYEGSLLNQRVGKFLIFNDEIIREYLFYCTQLKNFREYIVGNILRSAQGNISPKNIENIIIPLPPLSEQKAIAYVLSTIQEAKEKTEAV